MSSAASWIKQIVRRSILVSIVCLETAYCTAIKINVCSVWDIFTKEVNSILAVPSNSILIPLYFTFVGFDFPWLSLLWSLTVNIPITATQKGSYKSQTGILTRYIPQYVYIITSSFPKNHKNLLWIEVYNKL